MAKERQPPPLWHPIPTDSLSFAYNGTLPISMTVKSIKSMLSFAYRTQQNTAF